MTPRRIELVKRPAFFFAAPLFLFFIFSLTLATAHAEPTTNHSTAHPSSSEKPAVTTPPNLLGLPSDLEDAINTPLISINNASLKKSLLAFPKSLILSPTGSKEASTITTKSIELYEVIRDDLEVSNLFQFIEESTYIENTKTAGLTPDKFKFANWKVLGTEFLLKTGIELEDKKLHMEVRLYDVINSRPLLSKKYSSEENSLRFMGHTISNDIIEVLTGQKGIFTTKILFTSEQTGHKELWIMDYDGKNQQRLTYYDSIVLTPSFAPKSQKVLYSVYEKTEQGVTNVNLYTQSLLDGTRELLSSRIGLNTGAKYTPDEDFVVLTVSFLGNPDLFLLNVAKKTMKPLASSRSMDLEPDVSTDGKMVAFSSARFGKPMIFTLAVNNIDPLKLGEPTQISFAGRYNSSPSISPDGKKIVFAGYDKDHFDLFLVNTDGSDLQRLTTDSMDNENPSFSPDGQHIVFSSNRVPGKPKEKGKYNLYLIHIDGTGERRLTFNLGSCQDPDWSPYR